MSTTIDQAFIKQFEREINEAYQRQGSKLRNTVKRKNKMKINKKELEAALESVEWPKVTLSEFRRMKKAAQYLLSIYDDLELMIEARENTSKGAWNYHSDNEDGYPILDQDGFEVAFGRNYGDAQFITTAANAIARIAKKENDDDTQ